MKILNKIAHSVLRLAKIRTNLFESNAMSRNSREYFASLVNVSVGSNKFVLFGVVLGRTGDNSTSCL